MSFPFITRKMRQNLSGKGLFSGMGPRPTILQSDTPSDSVLECISSLVAQDWSILRGLFAAVGDFDCVSLCSVKVRVLTGVLSPESLLKVSVSRPTRTFPRKSFSRWFLDSLLTELCVW